jgi:hypothetical protein
VGLVIVGGSKCAMASEGGCQGRLERHHVFPKERLKRQFKYGAFRYDIGKPWLPAKRFAPALTSDQWNRSLDDILTDPRNLIWLCSEGHHERVTNHRKYTDIPDSVWEFCKDYGLTAELENDLARRVA